MDAVEARALLRACIMSCAGLCVSPLVCPLAQARTCMRVPLQRACSQCPPALLSFTRVPGLAGPAWPGSGLRTAASFAPGEDALLRAHACAHPAPATLHLHAAPAARTAPRGYSAARTPRTAELAAAAAGGGEGVQGTSKPSAPPAAAATGDAASARSPGPACTGASGASPCPRPPSRSPSASAAASARHAAVASASHAGASPPSVLLRCAGRPCAPPGPSGSRLRYGVPPPPDGPAPPSSSLLLLLLLMLLLLLLLLLPSSFHCAPGAPVAFAAAQLPPTPAGRAPTRTNPARCPRRGPPRPGRPAADADTWRDEGKGGGSTRRGRGDVSQDEHRWGRVTDGDVEGGTGTGGRWRAQVVDRERRRRAP
jgi:hypothetical protein